MTMQKSHNVTKHRSCKMLSIASSHQTLFESERVQFVWSPCTFVSHFPFLIHNTKAICVYKHIS